MHAYRYSAIIDVFPCAYVPWTPNRSVQQFEAYMIIFLLIRKITELQLPAPGDSSLLKIWEGVCGSFLETFTLIQVKICDFPYPILDPTLLKNVWFASGLQIQDESCLFADSSKHKPLFQTTITIMVKSCTLKQSKTVPTHER